jgi:AraC-like DNA-binding protein
MARHAHADFHELIYILRGGIDTVFDDGPETARAGEFLIYPRGVAHAEKAMRGGLRLLYFRWTGPTEAWRRRTTDSTGRVAVALRWLRDWPGADGEHPGRVGLLAAILAEASTGKAGEAKSWAKVRQHVRDGLAGPIFLRDLARVAGMSASHFARRFQAEHGVTPMGYVRQARVEAARTLLLTTSEPLRVIAPQVGFADEFQLSRVFREITGERPGAFARRARRSPAA